jgi:hypothetical protein
VSQGSEGVRDKTQAFFNALKGSARSGWSLVKGQSSNSGHDFASF